jgi:hypothetical protein
MKKVFWFFSSEKNCFLPYFQENPSPAICERNPPPLSAREMDAALEEAVLF